MQQHLKVGMQRLKKPNQSEEPLHFVHKFYAMFLKVPLHSSPTCTELPCASDTSAAKGSYTLSNTFGYSFVSAAKGPLTLCLANQWEPIWNVKSLPGTMSRTPPPCSSRLNALCDCLKSKKTSTWTEENLFKASSLQFNAGNPSLLLSGCVLLPNMGEYPPS